MAVNISLNESVKVDITIEKGSTIQANFDTLLLIGTQNNATPIIPVSEVVRNYESLESVASDFGTSSEIYSSAAIYFGQSPQPSNMKVALRYGLGGNPPVGNSSATGLAVDVASNLSTWNTITNGSFAMIYDNIIYQFNNLDFSSVTDEASIVSVIQTALDVEFSSTVIINYDYTNLNFYMVSTVDGKDITSIEAASYGTDITTSNLLSFENAYYTGYTIIGGYGSNLCGTLAALSAFQAISNGGVKLTINSTDYELLDMDFSSITSINEVAPIINQTLRYAIGQDANSIVYNNQLYIQGENSDLQITAVVAPSAGTDISTLAFGTLTYTNPYTYLQTPVETLQNVISKTSDFFGVGLTKEGTNATEVSDKNIINLAAYVQGIEKMYYCDLSNLTIASNSDSDILSTLTGRNYSNTVAVFNELKEYSSSAYSGIELQKTTGSYTMAYKQPASVSACTLGAPSQGYVLNKKGNLVQFTGGVNIYKGGTVCSESTLSSAIVRFSYWLEAQIQQNVFNIFLENDKVLYRDSGIQQLITGVRSALDLAVANNALAGFNNDDGSYTPPYEITYRRAADVSAAVRQSGVYNYISFTAYYADAITKATITGTLQQ